MAVITKYVVVRKGVELDMEFLVKKEAEAYDRMLDAADNLAAYIKDAGLKIDLGDETIDTLSVFLAKNGPDVTRILKGLKPAVPAAQTAIEEKTGAARETTIQKKVPAAKTKPKDK